MRLFLITALLAASNSYANSLSIDFKSRDFSKKGAFTFKPGNPLKIISTDDMGKPCTLVIESKAQKEDIIQFEYKLERNGKMTDGGTIITQRGKIGKIESGPEGQKPAIQFEVHWTD